MNLYYLKNIQVFREENACGNTDHSNVESAVEPSAVLIMCQLSTEIWIIYKSDTWPLLNVLLKTVLYEGKSISKLQTVPKNYIKDRYIVSESLCGVEWPDSA
jgi:hypothetical protein